MSAGRISSRDLSFSRAMWFLVQFRAGALGDAHAAAGLGPRDADARRLLVLGVEDRDVGDVDRALALDHADGRVGPRRVRALVALDHVQALDVDPRAPAVDPDDLAGLALLLAGDDDHLVVGADLHLEHLRSERDDAHEAAVALLARHGAEDAGPARVVRRVEDHRGVLVEGDVGAVLAPELLLRAHDDRLDDLALLDRALRVRLLDGGRDDVPHARVATAGGAPHADAQDLAGARVRGNRPSRRRRGSRGRPCCRRPSDVSRSGSLGLLEDVGEAPALAPRHRAALDHAHGVARARVVALVVGVQLRRGAHDLPVAAVAAGDVDAHDDRLVGLVGDHDALAHLRPAGAVLGRLRGLRRGLRGAALGGPRLLTLAVGAAQLGLLLAGGAALGVALLGRLGAG